MRSSPVRYLAAALALTAGVAGCGGSEKDPEKPSDAEATRGEPVKIENPKRVGVRMRNERYLPARITIPVGSTVVWRNVDTVPHTVTKEGAGPGAKFDSNDIPPGGRFKQRFTRPGEVNYFCRNHYQQSGQIAVK